MTETPEGTFKRVLLIRHGQTDWNAQGRWQGIMQVPLNEIGIQQAHALAEHLRERPITAVYTSDLIRANETARILGESLSLKPNEDPRLRELNLGDFQGLTYPEISAKFPKHVEQMNSDYMGFTPPNGESRLAMQQRAYEAFNDILAREPGPEIALVSHGGTIRVLLLKLVGDLETVRRTSVQNTSITIIETDGLNHRLLEVAAVSHLAVEHKPKLTKNQRDDV